MRPNVIVIAALAVSVSGCSSCSKSNAPSAADAGTEAEAPVIDAGGVDAAIPQMGQNAASVDEMVAAVDVQKLGVTSSADPKFAQLSLFQKLAVEKAFQPPNALKPETVFDAIGDKLKAPVGQRHQLAAFPVDASYCLRGETDIHVDLIVCEYASADALRKGHAGMAKAKTPRRDIVDVKQSTVSITRFKSTKEEDDQAAKIVALVKTL